MAAFQGTHYTQTFLLQDYLGNAQDLTNFVFDAMFRTSVDDPTVQLELSTANGGFTVLSPATAGRLQMTLTADQTAALPVGKLVFDVFNTNTSPGPDFMFRATIKVREAVTR